MGEGQDWASYQGPSPSAASLDFVGIKVTEGIGYANPYWRKQLAIVRAAGAVPVLYHYPHMGNGVTSEVKHFRDVLGPDLQPGDVLTLDWEGYDAANAGISTADQIRYKDAFLTQLAAAEPMHQVITYCNTDYLDRDPHGHYGDGLWIATAGRAEGDPGISREWLFHQYSERGGLDRDFTTMTRAELADWSRQKENDMPLTPADARTMWAYSHGDAPDVHQTLTDAKNDAAEAKAAAVATESKVDALAAEVAKLGAAGGATGAQLQAAAEAGARAVLVALGHDLEQTPASAAPAAS